MEKPHPLLALPRYTTSCTDRSRLSFLLVCRCQTLYRKLCKNVAVEVCGYLPSVETLPYVSPSGLLLFDPVTGTLLATVQCGLRLEVDRFSSAVSVSRNVWFVCGKRISLAAGAEGSAYLISAVTAVKVQNMNTERCLHGLIYTQITDSVYAFGGRTNQRKQVKPSNTCERFSFFSQKWEKAPAMNYARAGFTPCCNDGVVYLCGGGQPSIEKFVLETQSFELLASAVLPESSNALAIVLSGELIVLTSSFALSHSLEGDKETFLLPKSPSYAYSHISPLLYANHLYTLSAGYSPIYLTATSLPTAQRLHHTSIAVHQSPTS